MDPKVTALSERDRSKKQTNKQTNKKPHPVRLHLTLEKANRSIMIERTSVLGKQGGGRDRL